MHSEVLKQEHRDSAIYFKMHEKLGEIVGWIDEQMWLTKHK